MEKFALIQKDLGIVLTPDQVVDFLVRWAIRSGEDIVIDPGAGEGAFILAAFERLRELGASAHAASNRLYGVEYHEHNFKELTKAVREQTGVVFPHLYQTDLFDMQFPKVDAVIGNPPYVIRHRLKDSQDVRAKVALQARELLRRKQTDLYSYFIMYAASFLREGGRLAFIVSDSWLDMDFGSELKTFLLRNFRLQALISFDKRVFPDALVKTMILLAERSSGASADTLTRFIRIKRPV